MKIGQNTEKSPGDLRRLAVTQIPMRNHRLNLEGKFRKEVNNNNNNNTEKSPEDLRRLAVTQSPVKDHQLTLM